MELKLVYLVFAILGSFLLNRILWQFANKLRNSQDGISQTGISQSLIKLSKQSTLRENNSTQNSTQGLRIRWENHSKPLVGGVAFYLIFLLSGLLHNLFIPLSESARLTFIAPLAVGTMGFLVGLADDAFTTKPLLKLLSQIACGLMLISLGLSIHIFNNPILDGGLTIFWVVGLMNSINMLDNMDGVTGSVSVAITTLLFFVARSAGHGEDLNAYVMVSLVGALVGFLILNWKPSKIYMGDSGSQFLGAVLAAWGIHYLWNYDQVSLMQLHPLQPWALATFVFIVPIMDTTFVTIARLRRGQSPAVGGRDHTTHHLAYFGIGTGWIPVILAIVSVIAGGIGLYAVRKIEVWQNLFHLPILIGLMGIFLLGMLYIYQVGAKKQKKYFNTIISPEEITPLSQENISLKSE